MAIDVFGELKTHGLLLKADPRLPSVCGLIAGEPMRGSWWAHPRSHEMFRVLTYLAAHRDVLIAKLISGKDTLIHRAIWPAFLGVATAHEDWQLGGLDRESRSLLALVEKKGEVQATGKNALLLEKALLVQGEQLHTEAGSHAKILRSWTRSTERSGAAQPLPATEGKASLEKLVDHLNRRYEGRGRLPWV